MKLTNKQLRQIIKEELEAVMGEADYGEVDMKRLLSQAASHQVPADPSDTEGDFAYNDGVTGIVHDGTKYYIKGYEVAFAKQMGFKNGNVYIDPDDVRGYINETKKTLEDLSHIRSYRNNVKSPPKSFDYNNGLFAYTEDGVNVKSLDPDENGGYDAVVKILRSNGYRNNSVTVRGYR